MNRQHNHGKGYAAAIVAGAIILVACAGLLPWEDYTGGIVKNFDIFGDLRPETEQSISADSVDEAVAEEPVGDEPAGQPDQRLSEADMRVAAAFGKDSLTGQAGDALATHTADRDAGHEAREPETVRELPERKPNRVGELTVIEDYSADGRGLDNISDALSAGQIVRIAVVGDSYIEGDIMTQDLRARLQQAYGGRGVGYMNMHSEFPGFRRSVFQSGKGWKCYSATKRGKECYMGLSEEYAVAQGDATAEYKGASKVARTDSWDRSRFLFIAPEGGSVRTRTSTGTWTTHRIEASPSVQAIVVDSATSRFSVNVSSPSIISLGVWLDGLGRGISVDCMSSRGIPGYTLAKVPAELCHEMSEWIDYDLIILEFGINVLSARQRNYAQFSKNMENVVRHLRTCYPKARILLMGIGDRGEKSGGRVRSMSTVPAMIEAQRRAAMATGSLFWDTREAMGGEDAIVEWTRKGMANKDYVHLSHKGGDALAEKLAQALRQMIDR